jgi:RNA polymerase sigma-70 factor, ECF subfamily
MLEYYKELVYFAQKMVGNKDQAVEIIQETYVKTIEKSKETTIENERAFLYKVARNIVIDQSRKDKNKEFIEYEEEEYFCSENEQPDEIVLENVKEELLLEALETLPKHLKQVFVLHIFEGFTKKQIATMMNLNLNSVQKYVITATTKLTEYIEKKQWN